MAHSSASSHAHVELSLATSLVCCRHHAHERFVSFGRQSALARIGGGSTEVYTACVVTTSALCLMAEVSCTACSFFVHSAVVGGGSKGAAAKECYHPCCNIGHVLRRGHSTE
eukprot:1351484-Amphidinium_carterae.1